MGAAVDLNQVAHIESLGAVHPPHRSSCSDPRLGAALGYAGRAICSAMVWTEATSSLIRASVARLFRMVTLIP
jgi:hypothetical protein